MSGRASGGGPIRRRSARQAMAAGKKPDPVVLHDPKDLMHLAIERKDFNAVQRRLDVGDNFCRGEGLNCYKLAGDCTMNSSVAATGLHGALSDMHRAIACHDFDLVQRLLDKGDTFCTANGPNCFILAASHPRSQLADRWQMVEKMLQINSSGILARDEDGSTLLRYFWNEVDIVKQLIDLGVDRNAVDNAGKTLCESMLYSSLSNPLDMQFGELAELWRVLISFKEFEQQLAEHNFFKHLVTHMKCSEFGHFLFINIVLNMKLISIDVNFVNNYGKDLLENLFCSKQSHEKNSPQDELLKVWNDSMEFEEFQNLVKEIHPEVPFSRLEESKLAKKMFYDILKNNLVSLEELTNKLKMHPLFYILEQNKYDSASYLYVTESILDQCRKEDYSAILKDKTVLHSKDITADIDIYMHYWPRVKEKLNIPDNVTFDVIGYFLYNLIVPKSFDKSYECEGRALPEYLRAFLESGFIPVRTPGVVHPIHALLYNMSKRCNLESFDGFEFIGHEYWLPILLKKTIYMLKDYPLPHQQVLDPETGHQILDVHLLMAPLLNLTVMMFRYRQIGTPLLDCVKAFMPLSPVHPLQHFASFYSLETIYAKGDMGVVATYCQFYMYALKASGKHQFQSADQRTIDCVNLFLENLAKLKPGEKKLLKKHGLLISTPAKAEIVVGSLFWLSILQIRKTLFLRRSSTSITLPSLIKTLTSEGRLPKKFEADLLVYKPNEKLNF